MQSIVLILRAKLITTKKKYTKQKKNRKINLFMEKTVQSNNLGLQVALFVAELMNEA